MSFESCVVAATNELIYEFALIFVDFSDFLRGIVLKLLKQLVKHFPLSCHNYISKVDLIDIFDCAWKLSTLGIAFLISRGNHLLSKQSLVPHELHFACIE